MYSDLVEKLTVDIIYNIKHEEDSIRTCQPGLFLLRS